MANTLLSQLDSIAAQQKIAEAQQKMLDSNAAQQKMYGEAQKNIKSGWFGATGSKSMALMQCELERIENGYLIRIATVVGERARVYYAPDLKAVGEQITAIAVTRDLGGDDAKQT